MSRLSNCWCLSFSVFSVWNLLFFPVVISKHPYTSFQIMNPVTRWYSAVQLSKEHDEFLETSSQMHCTQYDSYICIFMIKKCSVKLKVKSLPREAQYMKILIPPLPLAYWINPHITFQSELKTGYPSNSSKKKVELRIHNKLYDTYSVPRFTYS